MRDLDCDVSRELWSGKKEKFIGCSIAQFSRFHFFNYFIFFSSFRMNHHHYQQRLNHQQIQQQLPPPIHGNRSGLGGLNQPQHQVPPPIIPKQHLHQNIATLNQKPPQHVTSQQLNSQIQPTQRLSYESELSDRLKSPWSLQLFFYYRAIINSIKQFETRE